MSRRPYVRPVSKTTWYMRNGRYKVYMLREMTSLLVGFYSFLTIFALAALASGTSQTWDDFLASQQNMTMIVFHACALIYFLLYQTFPWFSLAPKAMPIQLGEKFLPASFIVIGHYVAWFLASAFIFWLAGVI
jgi:fumarate reductase subunit C